MSICLVTYFIIIPREVESEIQRGLPPTFFPNLSVIWVGAFSLLLMARSFFIGNEEQSESRAERRSGRIGAVFTIAASTVYLILCWLFSFIISTVVILAVMMWALGERRWPLIAGATLATTFGIYVVFDWLMSVQLPEGILF